MTTAQREFDIVLYGATGFVGRLTAEYLSRAGRVARVALAGRSPSACTRCARRLGEAAQDWPIITADASSPSTLNAMADRTRVVVTTVGPYAKYGLPLVAACAAAGTDYADLTGEPNFVLDSIDHYHKQAARHRSAHRAFVRIRFHPFGSDGVRLVPARASGRRGRVARHQHGGAQLCGRPLRRHRRVDARTDGGVLERSRAPQGHSTIPTRCRRTAAPNPNSVVSPMRGGGAAPRSPRNCAATGLAAFAMAMPNSRIVRRSNALLDYGIWSPVRLRRADERRQVARRSGRGGSCSPVRTRRRWGWAVDSSSSCRARWSTGWCPSPVPGPANRPETTATTRSRPTPDHPGARYRATMAQQGDPGYKAHRGAAGRERDWRWRWIAMRCLTCMACSPRPPRWAMRCSPGYRPRM